MIELEHILPSDIEKTSFSIIKRELSEKDIVIPEEFAPVVMRVIHTTADFEYAATMKFSPDVLQIVKNALLNGAHIVTDTNMALAGINKKTLANFGGEAHCFMADEETARLAKEQNLTRAAVSMKRLVGRLACLIVMSKARHSFSACGIGTFSPTRRLSDARSRIDMICLSLMVSMSATFRGL